MTTDLTSTARLDRPPVDLLLAAAMATARKGLDRADCTNIHNHRQVIEAFTYLHHSLGRLMTVLDQRGGTAPTHDDANPEGGRDES